MPKKILFIAPDYYGFNEVVFDGLKEYSGAEVFHITSNEDYKYRNFGEKIHNFLSKFFLKKNIKNEKASAEILKKLKDLPDLDIVIINRPDLLSETHLNYISKKTDKTVALLWDSLEKIPIKLDILKKFNTVLSFDENDCKQYNFQKITNFYFKKKVDSVINYDIAFLGTFDIRFPILLKIFKYLQENNFKAKAKIFSYHPEKIEKYYQDSIENINKIIPFNLSFSYYLDSLIILDLSQPNQEGLSFRPFEAIGLEKKLITTSKNILNYDFYDSQNIYIINNIEKLNIPESFFTTPYKKLSEEISDKYFIKNWIQNIIKTF
jgi:hypothetical protein